MQPNHALLSLLGGPFGRDDSRAANGAHLLARSRGEGSGGEEGGRAGAVPCFVDSSAAGPVCRPCALASRLRPCVPSAVALTQAFHPRSPRGCHADLSCELHNPSSKCVWGSSFGTPKDFSRGSHLKADIGSYDSPDPHCKIREMTPRASPPTA